MKWRKVKKGEEEKVGKRERGKCGVQEGEERGGEKGGGERRREVSRTGREEEEGGEKRRREGEAGRGGGERRRGLRAAPRAPSRVGPAPSRAAASPRRPSTPPLRAGPPPPGPPPPFLRPRSPAGHRQDTPRQVRAGGGCAPAGQVRREARPSSDPPRLLPCLTLSRPGRAGGSARLRGAGRVADPGRAQRWRARPGPAALLAARPRPAPASPAPRRSGGAPLLFLSWRPLPWCIGPGTVHSDRWGRSAVAVSAAGLGSL